MDLMTLYATITLDTSSYMTGLREAESASDSFDSSGLVNGVKKVGQTVMQIGERLYEVTEDVLGTGAEFDTSFSKVIAVTNATQEQFTDLRNLALELGRTTVFTSTEAADAMYHMGQAGWRAEEIMTGLPAVLNLAAAAGGDFASVSSIVADGLNSFQMEADETAHFANVLAVTAANTNTDIFKMGESFKYVGAVAGAYGLSVDDVAESLGLMANRGIKAGAAGTALRTIIQRLASNTNKAGDVFERYFGVKLFDAEGNMRDFSDVIDEARVAWAGFNDETKATVANKIGGLRGSTAWFALMDSTVDDVNYVRDAINSADEGQGAAVEMAGILLDNLEGDLELLNSAYNNLKILISDEFKEPFRQFIQSITQGIGEVTAAFQEGGLLGVFINISDWIINGITNALTNKDVTGEQAQEFGRALGDFVGRTLSNLIKNAPAIIAGLFDAGLNLAEGLIDGLVQGLTGIGSGTVVGFINDTRDDVQDAINDADMSAFTAESILQYMDDLKTRYGNAATQTEAWQLALEKLKKVYPDINQFIREEGGELSTTNENLMAYIENTKQMTIENAKRAALQGYTDKYVAAVQELGTTEIKRDFAQSMMDSITDQMLALYNEAARNQDANHVDVTDWKAAFGNMESFTFALRQMGVDPEEVKRLQDAYTENQTQYNQLNAKIPQLEQSVELLREEMNIASEALARMSDEANSFSAYTPYGQWANDYYGKHSHAKGLNYVPYDNYPALLHRGEEVLTASQARHRDNSQNTDGLIRSLVDAITLAVRDGMQNVHFDLDGEPITTRVSNNIARNLQAVRFA